jgi:ankyrin repeat protein
MSIKICKIDTQLDEYYTGIEDGDALLLSELVVAVMLGNNSNASEIIKQNNNIIHKIDSNGFGIIHMVAWLKNYDFINIFKNNYGDLNMLDDTGLTALHYSIISDNTLMTIRLLQLGANPNIGDKDGNTCLHMAVVNNSISIIELLLVYDADPFMKNNKKHTPYDYSSNNTSLKNLFESFLVNSIN